MHTSTFPDVNHINRRWVVVNAEGQTLGRLASRLVLILRGKHTVHYTPFLDTGDFVVVINAQKIKVTGNKLTQKVYASYSGYPGGLKHQTLEDLLRKHPERVLQRAVKGMLPDGPLGRKLLGKLKVYAGTEHPHRAQNPEPLTV